MKNKINVVILLFVLLPFLLGSNMLYYFVTGFFYGYNSILEYKINKAFEKVQKTRDLQPITLQSFTKKKVIRVCAQTPYEPQFSFEERLSAKVSNYRETNDDGMYVLWLFFSDGSVAQIRPYQMNPGKDRMICKKQAITISFQQENHSIKFLILGE